MSGPTHVRVTLAVVLAVSLAGCGAVNVPFLGDADESDEKADEITADAVANLESVDAYNFTMSTVVEFGQNQLNMSADGSVNHSSERLVMESELGIRTNTSRSKEFSTVYVFADQRCRELDDDEGGGWNVTNDTTNRFDQGLTAADQRTLLNATGTEVDLLENETIRDQDVYVVRIRPNHDALTTVVENDTDVDLSNVDVQNATITQYVAQDSRRLLRSTIDLTYYVEGRLTTVTITQTYSGYGDVPPITASESARTAGCGTNLTATSTPY